MNRPELMAGFDTLQDEYYPGSKQLRRESQQQRRSRRAAERRLEREEAGWDARPLEVYFKGVKYEMFKVGALGKALGRDSVTIRSWIRKGWLPSNQFQTRPVHGSRGDAGRRLWTRAQIERIAQIAKEEGLLNEPKPRVQNTNFASRIAAEWKELRWR